MKTKNIFLILSTFLLLIALAGCGANNPSSGGTNGGQLVGNGGGSLALTVMFPAQTAIAPAALISTNTTAFRVRIYQFDPLTWWFGPILGYSYITAPTGGGQVTTAITLNNYTGWAWVEVTGYNHNTTPNSWMLDIVNITGAQNQPLQMAIAEMKQGVVIPAGTPNATLLSPDGVSYTINNLYLDLDPNQATFFQYNYMLGANVTTILPGGAVNGYFQSVHNLNPNSFTNALYFTYGAADIDIEVPNASRTVWNQYRFNIDFNNGPGFTPTNTPTIKSFFLGTYTFGPASSVVSATGTTPGASSTTVPLLNIASAAWANNIAPTTAQLAGSVTFYTQAPPSLDQITTMKHQALKPNSIKVGK